MILGIPKIAGTSSSFCPYRGLIERLRERMEEPSAVLDERSPLQKQVNERFISGRR